MSEPSVTLILVNYNNWKDTIECLESIFKLDYPNFRVVICDNASNNSSVKYIEDWAKGDIFAGFPASTKLKNLVLPYVNKPIKLQRLTRLQIVKDKCHKFKRFPVTLIQNDENKGFAAGNNLAIEYALNDEDCQYIWLLGCDTIITPDCLNELVKVFKNNNEVGLCGTCTKYYYDPDNVQTIGVFSWNKWFMTSSFVRKCDNFEKFLDELNNKDKLFGVYGTSMFFDRDTAKAIFPICEDYFLTCEEQEIGTKIKKMNKKIWLTQKCRIYHKEGGSLEGSGRDKKSKSYFQDFCFIRAKILFTINNNRICLLTVYIWLIGAMINRILRGQFSRVLMIIKIMISPRKMI